MDYEIYEISNDGYSPTGTPIVSDDEGNSVYYTPYSFVDSSSMIKNCISNHLVLSDNPNVQTDSSVYYRINDMIVDKDSSVMMITSLSPVDYTYIGSMIIEEDRADFSETYDASSYFNMSVFDDYTTYPNSSRTQNIYNRNDSSTVQSPFYHHRDIDTSVFGTKIYSATSQILEPYYDSSVIFDNNGNVTREVRLIINFNDGMRYVVPVDSSILDSTVTSDKQSYFIDNRYFYPYGYAQDSSYWSKSVFSATDETGSTAITDCKKFYDDRKILSAYVEFTRGYDGTNKTYRVPVRFGDVNSTHIPYILANDPLHPGATHYETTDNKYYLVKNS